MKKSFKANERVFVCIPGKQPYPAIVGANQDSEEVHIFPHDTIHKPTLGDSERVNEEHVYLDPTGFATTFNGFAEHVHANAVHKGFWEEERNFGEMIALMHSELSEALEAERDGNPASQKIPHFSHIEEEFADTIIRILDTCRRRGYNISGAILAKFEYNAKRPHKHGRKF
jgi:NTP pyrophosphatase (non-canonical NTP hydrolase)